MHCIARTFFSDFKKCQIGLKHTAAGFHHMRVLPAVFVRIVPSCDVNGVLLIRKLTSACRPRLALAAQSGYSKTSPCDADSFWCSRFRTRYRQASQYRNVSEASLQIFRLSKANQRQTQRADQKQIQWQSEKEKPRGRQDQGTFVTSTNWNRSTTELLLLIQSVKEAVALMHRRLC